MTGRTLSFSALLERPDVWCADSLGRAGAPAVPSGFSRLDAELPGGGWPAGGLTEILPAYEGIGELRLLGPALAALSQRGLRLACIAPPHLPYAPALAAAGIEPATLIVVRAASAKETLWAAEQALASNACGAVLAWPRAAQYAELRRLQVAAEGGRAPAFLFRPAEAAREPSPALLRIALDTARGELAVGIFKRRGAPLARPILLPAMPPAARARSSDPHHVDRHPVSIPPTRNFPARLVRA